MLKHRTPLARGGDLPANLFFTIDFCLCGTILNLKAFCFGAIPDIMIELIVYAYPEIMGSLLICISKMVVSSSQNFLQRFLKEIFCSGMRAFF